MRADKVYVLPDPELTAYRRGVGTLRVDGVLWGHLASIVGRMTSGQPWPWFVVVWLDGRKEFPFEDYGPGWHTVRELDAGYLEHHGPSAVKQRMILGRRLVSSRPGPPQRFDFEWLSRELAEEMWIELELRDSDF